MTAQQKVLVVDDTEDIRTVATIALGRIGGFDVATAPGGAAALERVRDDPPDCVVLDMSMPGMDGPATLHALRDAGFAAPVVLLTASDVDDDQLRALDVAGVLNKPFDPHALADDLRALLGWSR